MAKETPSVWRARKVYRPLKEEDQNLSLQETLAEVGETDSLSLYLHEVRRNPLLTAEEEIFLGRAVVAGQKAKKNLTKHPEYDPTTQKKLQQEIRRAETARQRMIESNTRLVIFVARKYRGRGLSLEDLIQEGNVGLARAVDKFDPERGFRFSTYGYLLIRQAITRAIMDMGTTIRLPVHTGQQMTKVIDTEQEFMENNGRPPTAGELIEKLQRDLDMAESVAQRLVDTYKKNIAHPMSLNELVGKDDDAEFGDFVASDLISVEDQVDARLLIDGVDTMLDCLTDRQKAVIQRRFGIGTDLSPMTLAKVGDALGVTRERVRQIEADALRKLRSRRRLLPKVVSAYPSEDTVSYRGYDVDLRPEPPLGPPAGSPEAYSNGPVIIIKKGEKKKDEDVKDPVTEPKTTQNTVLTDISTGDIMGQFSNKHMASERPNTQEQLEVFQERIPKVQEARERLGQLVAFLDNPQDNPPAYLFELTPSDQNPTRMVSTMGALEKAFAKKDEVKEKVETTTTPALDNVEKRIEDAQKAINLYKPREAFGLWRQDVLDKAFKTTQEVVIVALKKPAVKKQAFPEAPATPIITEPAEEPTLPAPEAPAKKKRVRAKKSSKQKEARVKTPKAPKGEPTTWQELVNKRKGENLTETFQLPDRTVVKVTPTIKETLEGLAVGTENQPVTKSELVQALLIQEMNLGITDEKRLEGLIVSRISKARSILEKAGASYEPFNTVDHKERFEGKEAAYFLKPVAR